MTSISGQSLVAGEWLMPAGAEFKSFNPYTGEYFNSFRSCGDEEIEQAMAAASEACQAMRGMDGKTIGAFLEVVADEIEALGDDLLETCDAETGLGLVRLTGERGRTCGHRCPSPTCGA